VNFGLNSGRFCCDPAAWATKPVNVLSGFVTLNHGGQESDIYVS